MKRNDITGAAIAAALLAAVAMLPFLTEGFYLTLALNVVIYVALCTAWTLFSGPTHLVSLATAAFFGVGTYAVAIGIDLVPFPLLILCGGIAGALFAAVVGAATLRLSGVYFVIFTLGLAELTRQLIAYLQTKVFGTMGLFVMTDHTERDLYWYLIGLIGLIFASGWLIGRSRLGFALRVIGDDELVARHFGIKVARTKIILFMVSGTFIGMVGAILAPRYAYIEPQAAFNPTMSFMVVIMALLGGTKRLWGPLVGVVPFTLVSDYVSATFPDHINIVIGLAFLVIVYVLPNGVTGALEALLSRRNVAAKVTEPAR